MIEFKKITDKNFRECVKMSAGEGSEKFVAPNDISLAQAYVALTNETVTPMPFAIYKDDTMVGFIMFGHFTEEQDDFLGEDFYEIWRFMIGEQFQGKGYGKEALIKGIDYIKSFPYGKASKLLLSYVPGNEKASGLYKAVGFEENGMEDDGEIVMVYDLQGEINR